MKLMDLLRNLSSIQVFDFEYRRIVVETKKVGETYTFNLERNWKTDMSLFSSPLVQKTIDAVTEVEKETGKTIEIIDPRTLHPFDMEAVKNSLRKTNRLLIAHEETLRSGFAGEISALINDQAFESLDAPIMRVAAKDTHVAYNPGLEATILPQSKDVAFSLRKLLSY